MTRCTKLYFFQFEFILIAVYMATHKLMLLKEDGVKKWEDIAHEADIFH